jgi:hypothetical protein
LTPSSSGFIKDKHPEDLAALTQTVVVYENGRVSNKISPTKEDYPVRDSPRYHLWLPPFLMNSPKASPRIHSNNHLMVEPITQFPSQRYRQGWMTAARDKVA